MPSAVSFRYARALADAMTDAMTTAGDGKASEAIGGQLAEFHTLLAANTELQIVFTTPAVPPEKKAAVLAEVAREMDLAPLTRNFLQVVLGHDRMSLLGEIAEAFEALLNERLGIAVAQITTAHPLEEAEKQELAGALGAKTGKQVRMNFSLDPALLGGVVARIGSTIYDGSVRGRLQRLRAELVED